jgi:outer membrane receptor for ferrienterochelin and colicin
MGILDQKLKIRGDLYLQNGVPVKSAGLESRNLNPLFDISAGAEYQLTDNIGLFARLNNLLDNRRQRWQHYPVLGMNGLVGLTARF